MRFTFETRLTGETEWTETVTSDLPPHLLVEWLDGWWNVMPTDQHISVRNFRLLRDNA